MPKVVFFRLETQADTTVHVRECCNQYGRWESQTEGNGTNWAGRHRVSVTKYTVLPNFVIIGKLLHNL
jgi:hypothetical protein